MREHLSSAGIPSRGLRKRPIIPCADRARDDCQYDRIVVVRIRRGDARHLFCERLLLAQHRDLASQPPILPLDRFPGQDGPSSAPPPLLSCPHAQLVGSHIQLPAHLGQRDSHRPPFRDQPDGFGLELGTELAPFTPTGWSCLTLEFHATPPPRNQGE